MADRRMRVLFVLALAFALLCGGARADGYTVTDLAGEGYYPDERAWTYHYTYVYPRLSADETDAVAMTVNETFELILDEMRNLAMPMFASSPEMTADGPVEVTQVYRVTCVSARIFSVLLIKSETQAGKTLWSLEPEVFDIGGEYPGETLTLRGLVRVGESSDQLAEAVLPDLYARFQALQESGVCRADVTRDMFEALTVPTLDFYADEQENAVFFLQPELMCEPGPDVPFFVYTPAELEKLAAEAEGGR